MTIKYFEQKIKDQESRARKNRCIKGMWQFKLQTTREMRNKIGSHRSEWNKSGTRIITVANRD